MSLMDQFKTKTVHSIDHSKLEQLTAQVYGKAIQMLEVGNDSTYAYEQVAATHEFPEHAAETLQDAIKSGGLEEWQYEHVFTDLCSKGLIVPGDYEVYVCW